MLPHRPYPRKDGAVARRERLFLLLTPVASSGRCTVVPSCFTERAAMAGVTKPVLYQLRWLVRETVETTC
jgi:hypothetical protein